MALAERLQELRKNNGLSQEQLAEKCNVSRQAVSKWELGQGYPETEKILQLAELFDVELDYLMRDKPAGTSSSVREEGNNIYKSFVGKWVKVILDDEEFKGLYQVAILAANNYYILFQKESKMGILKISDIKSLSDADANEINLNRRKLIIKEEIPDDCNPYEKLVGKHCEIRLKCNSLFTSPQGFYDVKINFAAADGIMISQKEKTSAIKIKDILMIIER